MTLHTLDHPLAQHLLSLLRSKQTGIVPELGDFGDRLFNACHIQNNA
jgi:uracil phosphoribosyltransferase